MSSVWIDFNEHNEWMNGNGCVCSMAYVVAYYIYIKMGS